MAAFLVVVLSALGVAYALVALATVKVWRVTPDGEGRSEDRLRRIAPEAADVRRGRRCLRSVWRSRARGGARCPQHRRRY